MELVPGTNSVAVHSIDGSELQRLPLMHMPLSATLAVLDAGDETCVVLDPSIEEEAAAEAVVSVALAKEEICAFQKLGGTALDPSILLDCLALARCVSMNNASIPPRNSIPGNA